jgi:hypothetical protein
MHSDPKTLFERYGATPLVDDDLEQAIRAALRPVLKHHGIVDNVIEADLTALVKTGISRTTPTGEQMRAAWVEVANTKKHLGVLLSDSLVRGNESVWMAIANVLAHRQGAGPAKPIEPDLSDYKVEVIPISQDEQTRAQVAEAILSDGRDPRTGLPFNPFGTGLSEPRLTAEQMEAAGLTKEQFAAPAEDGEIENRAFLAAVERHAADVQKFVSSWTRPSPVALRHILDALGYTKVFNAIGDAVEWKPDRMLGISVEKLIFSLTGVERAEES